MVFIITQEFSWKLPHSTLDAIADGRNQLNSNKFIIFLGNCKTEWSFKLSFNEERRQFFLCLVNHSSNHLEFLVDLKFKSATCRKLKKLKPKNAISFQDNEGLGDAVFELDDRVYAKAAGIKMDIDITITLTEKEKPFKRPRSTYRLGDYIPDKAYSDFTITCSDNVDLAVHRVLLSKSSQVFAAMFQIDMNERKKRKVQIEDVNSVIMNEILSFVYAGNVDLYGFELARDVFYAANKYAITSLEAICVKEMIRQTTKENVIEAFMIADLCDIQDLERKCLFLIHQHFIELKATNDWTRLTRDQCDKIITSFYRIAEPSILDID